jgi:hypothetical protein
MLSVIMLNVIMLSVMAPIYICVFVCVCMCGYVSVVCLCVCCVCVSVCVVWCGCGCVGACCVLCVWVCVYGCVCICFYNVDIFGDSILLKWTSWLKATCGKFNQEQNMTKTMTYSNQSWYSQKTTYALLTIILWAPGGLSKTLVKTF